MEQDEEDELEVQKLKSQDHCFWATKNVKEFLTFYLEKVKLFTNPLKKCRKKWHTNQKNLEIWRILTQNY